MNILLARAALVVAAAGGAGLAVELVWMRILALMFGSASFAAGAVVAAIMLGMAMGSAWAAFRPSLRLPPVLLALSVAALLSAPALRVLGSLGGLALGAAAIFMTLASVPMGMVVPLVIARTPAPGLIYATHTLGAALGTALTGFVLLPAFGNTATLWAAALVLGLLAFVLRGPAAAPTAAVDSFGTPPHGSRLLLGLYAVSAFAAMTSEIGWIRALVLSIGSSTYAYTVVLAVYIAGLGIGSALGARFLKGSGTAAFGALQLLIAPACLGALWLLGRFPVLFGELFEHRVTSLASFSAVALLAAAAALLLPAILVGACFPAAVRALGGGPRASGLLLAVSTGGSMVGALVASFISIPRAGLQGTLGLAILLHALAGSLVLSFRGPRFRVWPGFAAAAILAVLHLGPAWDVRTLHSGPYVYGSEGRKDPRTLLFAQDDAVASVAVFEQPDGNRVMRIDGKTDASLSRIDRVTQLLTAHLPLSVHGNPGRIALVGLGSGMTLASCLAYDPREVHCIEISPAVVRASRFFDVATGAPLNDPRVRLHVADARAVMKSIDGTFDVILNEPSNLWIAGMAGLFTEEFYRSCGARLAPGGVMGQWLHAYGVTDETFRDAVATFRKVFPFITVWELWVSGDYLFIGSTVPHTVDTATLDRWVAAPKVAADLKWIGVTSSGGLLGDLVAQSDDLGGLGSARIQTDDGLHLEFLAPLGFYGRRRIPPLSALPAPDAVSLGRVVKGREVTWTASRDLLRRGIRAVLDDRPLGERIDIFVEALKRYPEERQSRFLLEDQVEQCAKAGLWELVPPESRSYSDARVRLAAKLKKAGAAPGRLIEEYRKALVAFPDRIDALVGLAEAMLEAGALPEADEISARAVGKFPNLAQTRLLRGRVFAALKKTEDARAEWEVARSLAPDSPWGRAAAQLLSGK